MMPDIFFKMFKSSPKTVIKFLSNKSNFLEDLSIILKMPKWTFIKALFRYEMNLYKITNNHSLYYFFLITSYLFLLIFRLQNYLIPVLLLICFFLISNIGFHMELLII